MILYTPARGVGREKSALNKVGLAIRVAAPVPRMVHMGACRCGNTVRSKPRFTLGLPGRATVSTARSSRGVIMGDKGTGLIVAGRG